MIKPDGGDVLYVVGLLLVLGGAIAYDWRMAMIAGGVILLLTGIAAARRK